MMLRGDTSRLTAKEGEEIPDVPDLFAWRGFFLSLSDEEFIKKFWKILSTDSTMDNMRKDLHEDPKFKEWQEKFNKYLQEIIESDNSKSYEDIFTELGGPEMPNSTDYSDKLENLIKQVVDEKLRTLPEETKEEIFRKWDDRVKSFPII